MSFSKDISETIKFYAHSNDNVHMYLYLYLHLENLNPLTYVFDQSEMVM